MDMSTPFCNMPPSEKISKIDGISAQNQIFRKKKKPDFL